jgi:serine/threonine-protein kinase
MRQGEIVAGKYHLQAQLGVGGMGEVWSAQHVATGRDFAIKFMHAHAATSTSSRQRFAREARASAKINHPNIIDVFDVGELEDGALFLVMELLDGCSLGDALYADPPLSVRDLVAVTLDAARALAAAHAVGIVHRDIKPANIFLHRDRATGLAYAKILDFGISKFSANEDSFATKAGAVLGSPRYMSPEQSRSSAAADHQSDLWAMGVILFEALMGTWPHDGDSFSSLVVAIATQPPKSIDTMAPHLPEELRSIVRDCLRPISERMRTANELAARLEVALQCTELGSVPLAVPLHPPGESIRSSTNLRVRIPSLTDSASSGPRSRTAGASSQGAAPTPASYVGPAPSPASVAAQTGAAPAAFAQSPNVAFGNTMPVQPSPFPQTPGYSTARGLAPGYRPSGDQLTASLASMNVETLAMAPPTAPAFSPTPLTSVEHGGEDVGTRRNRLGIAAAVLGVLTVLIGAALIATVRDRTTDTTSPAARPTLAAPIESAALPATAPPAAAPASDSARPTSSSAGAPPQPTASASARAEPRRPATPRPAKPKPSGSKIDQLGSGL